MECGRDTIALMGATATGKSALGIILAEEFDGEIISMDSRQVYRGLDVGTGKVTTDEQRRVPHHLIDILDPREANSAGSHLRRAEQVWSGIRARGKTSFFVGGTGLYFRALFGGLINVGIPSGELDRLRTEFADKNTEDLYDELTRHDPERAAALSPRDRVRIIRALEVYHHTGKTHSQHLFEQEAATRWTGLRIVLTMPRQTLRDRIAQRTREMYRRGWVEEVRGLVEGGVGTDAPAMNSLGYDVIAEAIRLGENPEATLDRVITLTHQYAKRQETFFRSVPDAHWLDISQPKAVNTARRLARDHLGL